MGIWQRPVVSASRDSGRSANRAARALVARISFDYHTIPKPLTAQTAQAHAESYSRTVDYFRAHGVRAVNMSWGWSLKEIESSLEANNVGGTAAERGRLEGLLAAPGALTSAAQTLSRRLSLSPAQAVYLGQYASALTPRAALACRSGGLDGIFLTAK